MDELRHDPIDGLSLDGDPVFLEMSLRYLDGQLTPAERLAFNRQLEEDDARRQSLVALAAVTRQLGSMLEPDHVAGSLIHPPPPRRFGWAVLGRAAVAAVLVLAFTLSMVTMIGHTADQAARRPAEAEVIAALIDAQGAVWDRSDLPTAVGSPLHGGFLRLKSGSARIEFRSGAQVQLVGPTEFGLNSKMRGNLVRGEVRTYVPPRAKGFTIGGPGCAVIDLGTEFRMRVLDGGRSEVQVLRGRVVLQNEKSGQQREFGVGEAARHDARRATIESIPATPGQPLLAGQPCVVIPAASAVGPGWQVIQDPKAVGGQALRAADKNGEVVYRLRFSEPGTYYLYYRARAEKMPVGTQDSFFAPPTFGAAPSICVDAYRGAEARRYGGTHPGNNFLIDYQWFAQGGAQTPPTRYIVSEQDVAAQRPLELRIGTREVGFTVDRWLLSTDPDLFDHVRARELDAVGGLSSIPSIITLEKE